MVLEGKGYSVIDGVKHHWEAGDVLNLPLRAARHHRAALQHRPDVTAKFVATEPNWFECTSVDRGWGFEQLEEAPEYRRKSDLDGHPSHRTTSTPRARHVHASVDHLANEFGNSARLAIRLERR